MGEVIKKIIDSCRSLTASYQITNKTLTKFFIKAESGAEIIAAQSDDIKTLGKASEVHINAADVPTTVGIDVIDDQTSVFMDIKGLVDFNAEIKKLEKNLGKTTPALENLQKKMEAPGYEENVKDELKKANLEKMEGLQKKVADIRARLQILRSWHLLNRVKKII